jgi:hypothetical protein
VEALTGKKCKGSPQKDWATIQANARIWAMERDGDVVLVTNGDGIFTTIAEKSQ